MIAGPVFFKRLAVRVKGGRRGRGTAYWAIVVRTAIVGGPPFDTTNGSKRTHERK
jgi:hypothetical protein